MRPSRRRGWSSLLLLLFFCSAGVAKAAPPPITAQGAVLMDARTGQVLYARNPHLPLRPASITKIMTAYLAIRAGHLHRIVTVSQKASLVRGSSVYLRAGQRIGMIPLLYGLMLRSGNDAAVSIAQAVDGSVSGFVAQMNRTARALGARHTTFKNPDGLPDPGHRTTAYDMALFTRAALGLPLFRKLVATKEYPFPFYNGVQPIFNQNRLLWTYPGAIGVKIGYTINAGETIVSAATRGHRTLIAVVLHTSPAALWTDPAALLNYGFDHFHRVTLAADHMVMGNLLGSPIVTSGGFTWLVPDGQTPHLSYRLAMDVPTPTRLQAGQAVGRMFLQVDGKAVGSVPLVALKSETPLPTSWKVGLGLAGGGLIVLLVRRERRRRLPYRRKLYRRRW